MARDNQRGVYVDSNVYRASVFIIVACLSVIGYLVKNEIASYNERISRVEQKTDAIAENVTKLGVKLGVDVSSMVSKSEQLPDLPPPQKEMYYAMLPKVEEFIHKKGRRYKR